MKNLFALFFGVAFLVYPAFGQSVRTQKAVYAPGESIVVEFSGFPGNKQDWISIAQEGTADNSYITYQYTEGRQSGTITFTGMQYGNYEIRGYFNNEYILRARYAFKIGNVDMNISVKTQQAVYKPGENIVMEFSGLPGNKQDWISIAQTGTADNSYITFQYTEGRQNGTLTFDGRPYGDYEIRVYYNNEYTVRARYAFKVGNVSGNVSVKTQQPSYHANENIMVEFSGFPGNKQDWIGIAKAGTADNSYITYQNTAGNQSGQLSFAGLQPGEYEVRGYFNNEYTVRARASFVVGAGTAKPGISKKLCRNELSVFYAGMYSLGLSWGRLGSDVFVPQMISDVQATLGNVVDAVNMVACLDFDVNRIRSFSGRLPGLNRQQAVNEIDQLIRELHASVQRAGITCDRGTTLESLFITGVHLGASQAIANTFVCRTIPADWQQNLHNHLATARNGLAGFQACIPNVSLSLFNNVPVGAMNAYEPFSFIVGIHIGILWNVALSDCCCYCKGQ